MEPRITPEKGELGGSSHFASRRIRCGRSGFLGARWAGDRTGRTATSWLCALGHCTESRTEVQATSATGCRERLARKAACSFRWWGRHNCAPRKGTSSRSCDTWQGTGTVTPPPPFRGEAVLGNARDAGPTVRDLQAKVTDVITSPPYRPISIRPIIRGTVVAAGSWARRRQPAG